MSRRLPPLNALRTFEAAARHLSFTKAAAELHVTQAAVSHQIKALEEWLGMPLFRRLNRCLILTEAGQAYLPALRDAFEVMAEATERLYRNDSAGTLTVSTMPSFAAKWLVMRLGRFQAANPDLELRLLTTSQMTDFAQQDVDLAIRFGRPPWPGVEAQWLMNDPVFPVCAPCRLERGPAIERPADLLKHTLLHDDYEITWGTWFAAAGVDGADTRRGPRYVDSALTLQAAMEGQGVALARDVLVADDLKAGRLVRLFDTVLPGTHAYYVVAPPHYFTRPKVKAFRDWLFAEAASGTATPPSGPDGPGGLDQATR